MRVGSTYQVGLLPTVTLSLTLTSPVFSALAQEEYRGLEEVIVTARKREESVQNTPVSMVAVDAKGLKDRSIDTFSRLGEIAPNIEINGGIPNGGGSATQIFIRGIGQDDYSFPNEPGVGLYIDDVYVSRSAAADFGFMDVERIEILRGPQGTLYGRNTIGGAVKVVTKKPTGSNTGEIGVTIGRYNRADIYANYDFGVSDDVAIKAAVAAFNRDGLGTNLIGQDLGEDDEIDARFSVRWNASSSTEVLFSADYMRQEQAGPAGSMVRFDPLDATTDFLINGLLAGPVAEQFNLQAPENVYGAAYVRTLDDCGDCVYNSSGTVETRDDAEIFGASLTVSTMWGEVDFKSITAVRDYDIDIRRDSEHTPFNIVQVDNPETFTQITQEFQWSGTLLSDKLDYVVGAFGLLEDGDSQLYAPLLSGLYDAVGADLTAFIESEYDAFSLALYAEATYALSDKLAITFGGRLTHDDKEYVYGLSRPESGAVPLPPETLTENWTEFLPKIGLEYQIDDSLLLFANASSGYKAGGYNSRALSGIAPKAFDPEYVDVYEIGFKSTLADNTLILNGALFYNDYTDIQLLAVLDLGGGNVETVIENAGEATIVGGELEFQWAPSANLNFSGGVGFLDAEYDEVGASAASAGILDTNELINAPEISANLAAEYRMFLSHGEVALRTDLVYRDEQYRDAVNTPELKADAYTLWNGRVTWSSADERWEVAGFVTNITDEIFVTNGVSVLGLGYVEAYYSRPREWGVSVTMNFGS